MLGSSLVGLVGVYEEGGTGVSGDVDLRGFGSAPVGLGDGCGIVGWVVEGLFGWGWVSSFALKYLDLI